MSAAAPPGRPDDAAGVPGPGHAHDLRGRLRAIRAAAEDVRAFAAGLDDARLLALPEADRRTYRALKDALLEISERTGELPPPLLARHPGVDWRGWTGLRDMASQRDFGAELRRLGLAVAEDLPALLAAVEAELARAGDDAPESRSPDLG